MIKRIAYIVLCSTLIVSLVFYWNFTVFVVQPVGAVQAGATLIVPRSDRLEFIDSADAMCARQTGDVSLLCRAAMLGTAFDAEDVYARLPYFDWLYRYTTDGKSYP